MVIVREKLDSRAAQAAGRLNLAFEQVGEGFLRIAEDHVLEDMLRRLGASVTHIEAPFEPESGAYTANSGTDHVFTEDA